MHVGSGSDMHPVAKPRFRSVQYQVQPFDSSAARHVATSAEFMSSALPPSWLDVPTVATAPMLHSPRLCH